MAKPKRGIHLTKSGKPKKGVIPPQLKAHLFKKRAARGKARSSAKKTGTMPAGLAAYLAKKRTPSKGKKGKR